MNRLKTLCTLGASLILLFSYAPAQATSTDVVLNLEGNPTCSSLGDNSAVLELRDSSPSSSKLLTLPTPEGSQTLEYLATFGSGNTDAVIDEWRITSVTENGTTYLETNALFPAKVYPINYVVLKAQNGSKGGRVFHFGSAANGDGAVSDTNEVVPGPSINAISFCYGLTKGIDVPEPPIVLADLPDCDELTPPGGSAGDLFTTGIICPTEGPGGPGDLPEEQLIINLALNDPRFGFDATQDIIRACTCNTQLKPCNPALSAQRVNDLGQYLDDMDMLILDDMGNPITADDLSQEDRTCLEYNPASFNDRGTPDGVNDRVPFHIEGVENPDSYICYTIDGVRTCYGHY